MRFWLKVVSTPRTRRYVVLDESGKAFCAFTGGQELKISDATGAELGSLTCVDEYYFVRPHYDLRIADTMSRVDLAFRKLTIVADDGRKTVIARAGLRRSRRCIRDRSVVGHIIRRRFQGRRTYEIDLVEDTDPDPILSAVIAIDRSRVLKWHDVFGP